MAGNTFGKLFKLTTFGESHGEAIGGIIDGCPAGILIDFEKIVLEMARRKPGQSKIVSQRKESDTVQFLSGIFEGKTTGTPIGFIIPNENHKSEDYSHLKEDYRPSHADYVYEKKYGIHDYRGGGRSSARETASRVVGGAIAKQIISNIKINAFVSSVGDIFINKPYQDLDFSLIESNIVRCPDSETAAKMEHLITQVKKEGDTIGGTITCVIQNVPIGLGEPVFDKLHAELGKAMLSINAVKGFEFGSGFCGATMTGSQHNDLYNEDGTTKTNLSGGIQGGISNGMDIYFRVAFKPVATLLQKQEVLTNKGEVIEQQGKGRHDPCVVPRAVPIVEAMA
ncbi:MAG: chorismate synthase, partial [Flavobacterium sp.]|nr:chorismate synthase [Flavobacterium sp.]